MRWRKCYWFIVLWIFMLACGKVALGEEVRVLSLGHGTLQEHPTHYASMRLAQMVAERSNGRLKIEVYPNRQLGEEREMVEGLQLGTVDMTVVSTGPLGGFVPEINVVDLPFLFQDRVHAYGVLDGPIGQTLLEKFLEVGIVGAAFWENGWRHVTSNKPIKEPAELQGIKIRTMENEIHMATFRALGAGPVPMVWGEVYTSLAQGVIDAQENPIPIIYVNNLWEVQKYVSLTAHFYSPHVVLISKKTFDRLPKDLQSIVLECCKEVATYQRIMSARLEDRQKEKLREQGMEIIEVDRDQFFEAVKGVYEEYKDRFGTLLQRIRALTEE